MKDKCSEARRKFLIGFSASMATALLSGCQINQRKYSVNSDPLHGMSPNDYETFIKRQVSKMRLPTLDENKLLAMMDNSPWVPDGHDSEKHAYVLASTNCPFSKVFYQKTRRKPSDLQLRWIITCNTFSDPLAHETIVEAAFNRDHKVLEKIFNDGSYRPSAKQFDWRSRNAFQYIKGVEDNIFNYEENNLHIKKTSTGYPSILFASNVGLQQVNSQTELINKYSAIIPRRSAKSIIPHSISVINNDFTTLTSYQESYVAREDYTPAFCLPDITAPLLSMLPKDTPFSGAIKLLKIDNTSWLEMQSGFHDGNIPGYFYVLLDSMKAEFS
ncbi:MAG: hypothetical protein WCL60_15045 [Methylococcales bacterium]